MPWNTLCPSLDHFVIPKENVKHIAEKHKDQQQHSKSAAARFLALILPLPFHKALGRSVRHPLPYPSPSFKAKLNYLHTWLEQKEGEDKI